MPLLRTLAPRITLVAALDFVRRSYHPRFRGALRHRRNGTYSKLTPNAHCS
jgi:hypothetical protein